MEKLGYYIIESKLKCDVKSLAFQIDIDDIQKKIRDCYRTGHTAFKIILLLPDMKLYGAEVEFEVRENALKERVLETRAQTP